MARIHVVTDSSAQFVDATFARRHGITVVPNRMVIGGETYREGIDITNGQLLDLIAGQRRAPKIIAPGVADFVQTYSHLTRSADAILSLHASREIFPSWQNARIAAQQVMGHCRIEVIDSKMLCAAQGVLVEMATAAITEGKPFDEVVRRVRGAVERVYAVYYTDSIDFLLQNQILNPSHGILGALLGIRPFLTIEDGQLRTIEKSRTGDDAIERLVEFAAEFEDLETVAILQRRPQGSRQTNLLQDRLQQLFPEQSIPQRVLSSTLGALIGADATGLIILEKETDETHYDFE
ncbi:MAG: DegV family protein [Phototrophicaceae bacterium]